MNSDPKVLFLATNSYAGMGPYVISIINSFSADDNIRLYLVDWGNDYYKNNLKPELRPLAKIVKLPTQNIPQRFLQVITGKYKFRDDLLSFIKKEGFDIIHPLSNVTDLQLVKRMSEISTVFLTIHDLHPHSANKAFYKEWRQNKLYDRIFKSINFCKYLNTNSLGQLAEQRVLYPEHRHFFTNFPTLMTEAIKHGTKIPAELTNVKHYILFFGRIEAYKGIDVLIEAFKLLTSSSNLKLVIAGKGDFDRSYTKDVIYINRYIDDEEIAYLYQNAECVVYPYTSATQSGVLSIASYFGTPMITSDIPYFKEVLGDGYPLFFSNKDIDSLFNVLNNFLCHNLIPYKKLSSDIYISHYSSNKLKEDLLRVYNTIYNEVAHTR